MSDANMNSLGKKIFFLHPSAFLQNQIISELAQEEFEVYIIKDAGKFRRVLWNYPGSVIFASINEAMKESAWEEYIRDIQKSPEGSGMAVGIIAAANDEALRRKYTELLKVNCGYTVLKSDYDATLKQLVNILNGINAKGRRKFIRLIMENDTKATVNLPINGTFVNGVIKDISVVGFSCVFTEDPGLKKNAFFGDIQLRLQSQLLKAEGIVFGSRTSESEQTYVFLFTQRVDPSVKTKIRKYIQTNLQGRIDAELK